MEKNGFIAGSKWVKHRIVSRSAVLHACLPMTELYSLTTLQDFLARYPVVFIKPEYGSGGRRVFQIVRQENGSLQVKLERQERILYLEGAHAWIEKVRKGKTFLIQQGIDLAPWHNRPVDLRTILQRNEQREWEVTAMFAKAAGHKLAVTNVCIGGRAYPVEKYLYGIGYNAEQSALLVEQMKRMSLLVVEQLDEFANTIYGLDIGLDRNGNLWLIEVNTIPSIGILKRIHLPEMYARATKLWLLNRAINKEAKQAVKKQRTASELRRERRRAERDLQKRTGKAKKLRLRRKQRKVR